MLRGSSENNEFFLLPDPDEDWKVPFVVDQLWIIRESNARIRLLVLEVDTQFDLTAESETKSKIRDEKLARQGFEVYHVAGWWCLVDSWKVISEFLRVADVYRNVENPYGGFSFNSINDYMCERCRQPMVRFDNFWIEQIRDDADYDDDDSTIIVHNACIDNF